MKTVSVPEVWCRCRSVTVMPPRSGRPTSSIDRRLLPRTTFSLLSPQTRLSPLSTVNIRTFHKVPAELAVHSKVSHRERESQRASVCASLLAGLVVCEEPNNQLYTFRGQLQWRGQSLLLDQQHLLLRGTVLRNTHFAYGLVLYAGTCSHFPQFRKTLDTDIDFRRRLIAARRCWRGPYSFSGKVKWFLTNL